MHVKYTNLYSTIIEQQNRRNNTHNGDYDTVSGRHVVAQYIFNEYAKAPSKSPPKTQHSEMKYGKEATHEYKI